MSRVLKRGLAVLMVFALCVAMALPVLAADDDIYPNTGTQVVYKSSKSKESTSSVYVSLASGSKAFTIKRSSVKVTPGSTGADMYYFSKNYSVNENEYDYSTSGDWDVSKWENYSYEIGLHAKNTGTAKVTYKIGKKSYTTNVKILAYTNPVKSITVTGINSGKSFANLTKNEAYAQKDLKFKSTVKSAKVQVQAAKGWKITSLSVYDSTKGENRSYSRYSEGVNKATLFWGTLNPTNRYSISVSLRNTSNNASLYCSYSVVGSKATKN